MACLEMYNQNSEHKGGGGAPPMAMSPRISFSNDFAANHHQIRDASYTDAPVSSDFEFSVSNYSMISADELFFKGRLLPLKDTSARKTTTLRDELRHDDDGFSLRPPKNPTRWRDFLGLRKSHIGSKKSEKSLDKTTTYHHDDGKNSSQDYVD